MKKFFAIPFCTLIFFTFMSLEVEGASLANENTLEVEENALLGNEALGEGNTITPLMMSATVRNTFWQRQVDNGRWSDPYNITYRNIMFRYNFSKTGTNQIYNSGGLLPTVQFQDVYRIN